MAYRIVVIQMTLSDLRGYSLTTSILNVI